ncbi:MAG: threonylcarbamoyl-AMP synthase [Methanomicrobiaceae archaeon]|nr:threonylcarbamoyl-AMP synthase [Methanomicrobiaceae archaeon]
MNPETEEAVCVLRHDGLIVYPTETVYGLGCDAFSDEAIHRLYMVKNRPLSKPVSIAVSDIEMLHAVARVGEREEKFIRRFLPGPVTVILPAKKCIPSVLTGGTGLIGIRMPDNAIAREIIDTLGSPVTSTSANISGDVSPVDKSQVNVFYDYMIDSGTLPGTPSTVVDLVNMEIIRVGAMIEEVASFIAEME